MKSKVLSLSIVSIFALILLINLTSAVVIAKWDFESQDLTPVIDTTSSATLTADTNGTETFPAGNDPTPNYSLSYNDWNTDEGLEISIDTTGYESFSLRFDEQASAQGPQEFKILYSSDGTNFNELTGSTTSTSSSFGANPMHSFVLSNVVSIEDNANTKIKIVSTSDAASSAGTWRIDNLVLEASEIQENTNEITNFCKWDDGDTRNIDNPGDLEIDVEFNVEGFGDDNEWLPFDEIEVEVEIENKGDYDVENIEIEWGLYNKDTGEWTIDVDDIEEIDLDEDDEETITFKFKIDDDMDEDLDELDDGENYIFYIRATGQIDDNDADSLDGSDTCASDSETIDMIIEDDFVIATNIDAPESVSCGSSLKISADIWNIGDDDQDDVKVRIMNSNLGIDEEFEFNEIEAFESEKLELTIEIPDNAEAKEYLFNFKIYDEDNDVYENEYDDDESVTTFFVTVSGDCEIEEPKENIIVNAELESGGKVGEELVVKAIITNTGDEATFLLNSAGHASWATLKDISPGTVALGPGESQEVLISFDVKNSASEEEGFTFEVVSDGQVVLSKPILVPLETSSQLELPEIFGDNWYLWLIGALNIILIVIIIIIAVKVAKK